MTDTNTHRMTDGHGVADAANNAADTAKNVAGVARDEAKNVAGEAKGQLGSLFGAARSELSDQARTQTDRAASSLRTATDDLRDMASKSESTGMASGIVTSAADRIGQAANWMEGRDPADLLDDVRAFARRRPLLFIGIGAAAGVLAGRLMRSVATVVKEDNEAAATPSAPSAATYAAPIAPVYPLTQPTAPATPVYSSLAGNE